MDYADFVLKCREEPEWCLRGLFQEKPWSKQLEVIESVRDNAQTAVRSCHAAGKSFIASRTGMWFCLAHPGSIVITTAPSNRQVKNIIWKEIRSTYSKVDQAMKELGFGNGFGGRLMSQELRLDDDWFMIGFTAPEYDSDKFQGFHAKHILVIMDEACGISNVIYDGIEGILTSTGSRRLEIGNPTDPNTAFCKSFSPKAGTNKIQISVYDTPNFTANGITEKDIIENTWQEKIKEMPYPTLATPEWAYRVFLRHGRNSNYYKSRVLAEFPDQGTDTLIPLSFVTRCQDTEHEPVDHHSVLGVDVARYGENETVIYWNRGKVLRKYASYSGLDTMATAGKVIQAVRDTGAYFVNIDTIGVGAGVVDRLIEIINAKQAGDPAYKDVPDFLVNGINVGMATNEPDKYMNLKVELWFMFRTMLENKELDLDPEDEQLESELCSLRYQTTSTGKAQMESKEAMMRRGEQSPDHADAALLAAIPCAVPIRDIDTDHLGTDGVFVNESTALDGFL